jgi:hypothetical protein
MKQLRKRRFLPVFFFSLFLAGTCAFLYFFAILPRKTDAATPAAKNEIKNEIKTQAKDEAPTVRDLLTRDPTKVYTAANRVSTSGVGRIAENTAQGRLLAKRAALTDARRNLLELRQKLLGEPVFNFGSRTLSGHIIVPNIRSERIEGDLYHLDIDVKLEELLKADLDEEVFILPWQ